MMNGYEQSDLPSNATDAQRVRAQDAWIQNRTYVDLQCQQQMVFLGTALKDRTHGVALCSCCWSR